LDFELRKKKKTTKLMYPAALQPNVIEPKNLPALKSNQEAQGKRSNPVRRTEDKVKNDGTVTKSRIFDL
jgi:hypothetical protein